MRSVQAGLCVWCIFIFGYVVSKGNISLHRRWYDDFRLWERV